MAEVKEMVERFRRGERNFEELIAAMTLMQGQFDPNSFLAGLLFGRGSGHGSERAALLLALTAAGSQNTQAQQQTTGMAPAPNAMQQLLPFLLLLGGEEVLVDRTVEIAEKKAGIK
jgi:hypothetical protein